MRKKRTKKEEKEKKIEVKEVIKYLTPDGIIKTELGFNVVHNGKVEKEHFGSNSYRVAIKDYAILLGV